jgi:hypothetical protein
MNVVTEQLATEQDADTSDTAYLALLARLSTQSVTKHFDAYGDVGWDDRALEEHE